MLAGVLVIALLWPVSTSSAAGTAPVRERAVVTATEATAASMDPWLYRKGIRRVTNRRRTERGLAFLRWQRCLNRSAQDWAEHLADTGQFRHQDLGPILDACGLRLVGENLALGYTYPPSTVPAWMGSPGHRANLLDRRHRITGVGYAHGSRGWVTVQLLGRGR